MTSTLEEQLQEELDAGFDENDFVVKNLRRQIEAKKSQKGTADSRGVVKHPFFMGISWQPLTNKCKMHPLVV